MTMLTIEQLSYLLKFAIQKMKQPGVRRHFPLIHVLMRMVVFVLLTFLFLVVTLAFQTRVLLTLWVLCAQMQIPENLTGQRHSVNSQK